MKMRAMRWLIVLWIVCSLHAQVYSPKLLREGQPDPTDLKKFVAAIYTQAGAHTEREKAEAIWRFFLTDGRFVKPGFWYHIAGWTYEEPTGEVLDPMKLLNSYGFGLCYHIAPLLEAMFDAGGFADARCWFLTGHTVTEVFYDGAYHYYDSDMMGYNVSGTGAFQGKPVASVRALEQDPNIILGKLQAPDQVRPGSVDEPWYPADVREKAMGDLASLFTSSKDNFLYPYTRYTPGHQMDFVLRPGEKLIRFFQPEEPGLFYLPYKFDGAKWAEFPQEIAEYQIRTADGPRSQKDARMWATGRIEYAPPVLPEGDETVIGMPSPYVIIDARFRMNAELKEGESVRVETSTNGRQTWTAAGELKGPHRGEWAVEPAVIATSAHGRLTAVSGTYGYDVRITKAPGARVSGVKLVSRIQVNPRSLPAMQAGDNTFVYSTGAAVKRVAIPAPLERAPVRNLQVVTESGQCFLRPVAGQPGEADYALSANGDAKGALLTGFDVGARLLDMRDGLAPDKLTAETRHTESASGGGDVSIAWSATPDGPFQELWSYPRKLQWRDGETIDRLLRWPEVFREVRGLPAGTERVYVKIRSSGPAIDDIRLAVYAVNAPPKGRIKVTQVWHEGAVRHEHTETMDAAMTAKQFAVHAGAQVTNDAVIMSADER